MDKGFTSANSPEEQDENTGLDASPVSGASLHHVSGRGAVQSTFPDEPLSLGVQSETDGWEGFLDERELGSSWDNPSELELAMEQRFVPDFNDGLGLVSEAPSRRSCSLADLPTDPRLDDPALGASASIINAPRPYPKAVEPDSAKSVPLEPAPLEPVFVETDVPLMDPQDFEDEEDLDVQVVPFDLQAKKVEKKPENPEAGARIQVGKTFDIGGSIVTQTDEVKQMREAHERGRPLAAYELMQGMVDYGVGRTPPPRINVKYADGSYDIFDGTPRVFADADDQVRTDIVEIEFFNAGPGLKPEELVILRHGETESATKGKHGRGTTIAMAYLTSRGFDIDVTSNCYGFMWHAKPYLEDTVTNLDRALHASGQFVSRVAEDQQLTRFSIKPGANPEAFMSFCVEVVDSSDLFLDANPRYPAASLIPTNYDVAKEAKILARSGRLNCIAGGAVLCLDGMVDAAPKGRLDFVYVDGIKIISDRGYPYSLLPWAFMGLGSARHPYRVARGNDSASLSYDDISRPIQVLLENLGDRTLLKKLIELACDSRGDVIEFSRNANWRVSDTTKALVLEIWQELFEGALINYDSYTFQRYEKQVPESQRKTVKTVSSGVYKFLKACGIDDLSKFMLDQHAQLVRGMGPLSLPFLKDGASFEGLVGFIIKRVGEGLTILDQPEIVNGKPCLVLAINQEVTCEDDFKTMGCNDAGICLRAAAIVAQEFDIPIELCCASARGEFFSFDITSQLECSGSHKYSNEVEILEYQPYHAARFANLPVGYTYILIGVSATEEEQGETAEGLVARAKAQWSRFANAIAEQRRLAALVSSRHDPFALGKQVRSLMVDRASTLRNGLISWRDSGVQLGNFDRLGQSLGALEAFAHLKPRNHIDFLDDVNGVAREGFYVSSVTSSFGFDPNEGIYTQGQAAWARYNVPLRRNANPSAGTNRHQVTNLDGECLLPVLIGHKIIGAVVEGAEGPEGPLEFYRDLRTGIFSVIGRAERVIYITAADDQVDHLYHRSQPPYPEECLDVIDRKFLDDDWKAFLKKYPKPKDGGRLSSEQTRERVGAALKKWNQRFTYCTDMDLNDQFKGDSLGEVAAKMLNTGSGICNVSASAFTMLLRAMGVPSQMLGGFDIGRLGKAGSHMTDRFWDGEKWCDVDPGKVIPSSGNVVPGGFKGKMVHALDGVDFDKLKKPLFLRRRFRYGLLIAALGLLGLGALGTRALVRANYVNPNLDESVPTLDHKVSSEGDGIEDDNPVLKTSNSPRKRPRKTSAEEQGEGCKCD